MEKKSKAKKPKERSKVLRKLYYIEIAASKKAFSGLVRVTPRNRIFGL
jgi:hypothetical protein